MDEKEAWEYIRKSFYKSNLNWDNEDQYNNRLGMCRVLTDLYSKSMISTALYRTMSEKINFHLGSRIFLYPLSLYGARKRREFCRDRIKELDNVLTNRFSST